MICYGATTAYAGLFILRGKGISNSYPINCKNFWLRFLCLIICVIIPVGLMFAVSSESDYALYLIVVHFLPWALIGVAVYFALPLLFYKVFKVNGIRAVTPQTS